MLTFTNIKKREEKERKKTYANDTHAQEMEPPTDQKPREDSQAKNNSIPEEFARLVKSFYPEPKIMREFWRMSTTIAYRNCREKEHELIVETSIESFKQLIRKIKTRKEVRNPIAYYTGILNKKYQEMYFEELYQMKIQMVYLASKKCMKRQLKM